MVTWLPPIIDIKIPPTTAATMPAIGGTPLANANPKQSGNAMSETTKPGKMSFLGDVKWKVIQW